MLARFREEHSKKGQATQFDILSPFLTGDQDRGSYSRLASTLKMSEPAARTAVHRLRRRYAELIREEIAGSIADPAEVEGEIRFLLAALERV